MVDTIRLELLKQMLNYGSKGGDSSQCPWKVLILDAIGQKIMSPVLKVNDLREQGVTLHLYNSQ